MRVVTRSATGSRTDQQRRREDRSDRDRGQRYRQSKGQQVGTADDTDRNTARRRQVVAHGGEQEGSVQDGDHHDRGDAEDSHHGCDAGRQGEDRAEQHVYRGPGGARGDGVFVEEQRRQAQRGAEHDAGGEVPASGFTDADELHDGSGDHVEGNESVERRRSDQERGGPAGGADVGEGVSGERLSPDDREHSHDPGHDRRDRTHDQRDVDRLR